VASRVQRALSTAPVAGASPARAAHVDFRAVFDREFAFVWNTLRRLGVREADREDLTHEVFLRVFHRLAHFDPSRPLRPWLFGFAYRCAADHRRLAHHRREHVGLEVEPIDERPSPGEAALGRDMRDLVARALAELALERRAVLLLHDVEGASAPEIAAALGIPINTVYSRLRAARQEFSDAVRRLQRLQGESP
jgi:RNA polymerase sigma-70 factor (ECF subfamily)